MIQEQKCRKTTYLHFFANGVFKKYLALKPFCIIPRPINRDGHSRRPKALILITWYPSLGCLLRVYSVHIVQQSQITYTLRC